MTNGASNGSCDELPQDRTQGANILDNKVNQKASIHPSITTQDETDDARQVTLGDRALVEPAQNQNSPSAPRPSYNDRSESSYKTNNNASQQQRKASVDDRNDQKMRQRRQGSVSRRYKRTACFVHSLLEVQQRFEKTNLNSGLTSITGSETTSRATSPTGRDREAREAREAEKQANDTKRELFTHLSKKEISDMALGVRELSKHLGSARLKLNIHHILIVTKTGDESLIPLTLGMTKWLLTRRKGRKESSSGSSTSTTPGREEKPLGYTVYIEKTFEDKEGTKELRDPSNPGKLKYWTPELCTKSPSLFDFVITLGGDGTVLYASWLFQRIVPPVLSFALGSLGFMTMFDFDDHQRDITSVLQEGVTAALRMRIECTIYRANRNKNGDLLDDHRDLHKDIVDTDRHGEDSEPTHTSHESFSVLNDLVVDRGPNPFMSSTELYGDDEHLTSIAADGVVISTPTGSTAYSLSAGGSLCHPEIPAILVSPICPHTLSFRPLLVPDSMVLRVAVPYDSRSTAWASFDGRNRVEIKQGDYVRISASRFPFPTCLRGKQTGDWFESVSRTLNWNERKKQLPYR